MTGKVQNIDNKPLPSNLITEYWARCVYSTLGELRSAFYDATHNRGFTQEIIAKRLKKNKSVISRILGGHNKNITIKTLSELSLAMDCDLQIKLIKSEDIKKGNYFFQIEEQTNKLHTQHTVTSTQTGSMFTPTTPKNVS